MTESVRRMPPEEVSTLARRIVTNEVFYTFKSDDVTAFQTLLALMSREDVPADFGAAWESFDKAGPVSMNGYPIFLSMHLVHRDDHRLVIDETKRMLEALGYPEAEEKADG